MRHILFAAAFVSAVATGGAALAQDRSAGASGTIPGRAAGTPCVNEWQRPGACEPRAGVHNPRDLTGVWARARGAANMTDAADALLTSTGRKLFEANLPSFGRRAVPPAVGNDPMGKCDPLGLTRNVLTEVAGRGFEFVQLPDRLIQTFEWAHSFRVIWTDGRMLPGDPQPRWMGYSVGRWDGDTLVVTTTGLDERTWLDHLGHPHSANLVFEERYRRPSFDTMEMVLTVTDPEIYTKSWVSDVKVHRLNPEKSIEEKLETFCVPSEEEAFNRAIRDPAAGLSVPKP